MLPGKSILFILGASSEFKLLEQQAKTQIDKTILDTNKLNVATLIQKAKLK